MTPCLRVKAFDLRSASINSNVKHQHHLTLLDDKQLIDHNLFNIQIITQIPLLLYFQVTVEMVALPFTCLTTDKSAKLKVVAI